MLSFLEDSSRLYPGYSLLDTIDTCLWIEVHESHGDTNTPLQPGFHNGHRMSSPALVQAGTASTPRYLACHRSGHGVSDADLSLVTYFPVVIRYRHSSCLRCKVHWLQLQRVIAVAVSEPGKKDRNGCLIG